MKLHREGFSLDLDLNLPASGVTALYGPSGCGKTTLLRCLSGLEKAPDGHVRFMGESWQSPGHCLPVHRRPLAMVFQESSLFPHLTVRRNLLYGQRRLAPDRRTVSLPETVAMMGLESLLERRPWQLSGGQRQRVAMARALLRSPRLLLMDEPLASLDDASKSEILPYLQRLHRTLSIPLIYVSHDIRELARIADHLVLMESGRVLAQGPLNEMLTRSDLPLAHSEHASAVVEARVVSHSDQYHLTQLSCAGGKLWVSRRDLAPGALQRVRLQARDLAIALSPPVDTSVSNCLSVTIAAIHRDPDPGHVLVELAMDGQRLLSRITRQSCQRLSLAPGQPVHALVKSVSLD
ncbi:MAG: molybdenum ABC transporter ATP-binding protein [Oleiphilaceae bacterium]|nr:molybdenum ABC transporter ATP-binding protein [Oleiphilaceae bacterium]